MRGRHAGEDRGVPGDLREVGRDGHRHRGGHRHRPARRRLARRDHRRRAAAHGSPRRAGVRAAVRPPDLAGRAAGRHARRAGRARPPATSCAPPCCGWSPRRTSRRRHGSPTSTTATSWATPCWPSRRTPASSGSTRTTGLGVALATDGNGRFAKLDPYAGAQLALAEAYRNVAATGARAARGHRLPELRLARGPGRDVAVRRGRPRAGRRLPRSSASRSPAATSASTTRPATSRSTRPRSSACSA